MGCKTNNTGRKEREDVPEMVIGHPERQVGSTIGLRHSARRTHVIPRPDRPHIWDLTVMCSFRWLSKRKGKYKCTEMGGQVIVGNRPIVVSRDQTNGAGLLTCQLVSGRPETSMRKIVRRGRGILGRSIGPGMFSLRRGPRANCTVRRSPLKSLPSATEMESKKYPGQD